MVWFFVKRSGQELDAHVMAYIHSKADPRHLARLSVKHDDAGHVRKFQRSSAPFGSMILQAVRLKLLCPSSSHWAQFLCSSLALNLNLIEFALNLIECILILIILVLDRWRFNLRRPLGLGPWDLLVAAGAFRGGKTHKKHTGSQMRKMVTKLPSQGPPLR